MTVCSKGVRWLSRRCFSPYRPSWRSGPGKPTNGQK